MTQTLFENPAQTSSDTCSVCSWYGSEMCPRSSYFVGRPLANPDRIDLKVKNQICHRFVLNKHVKERRWQELMDKLSTNLGGSTEDDWPF